MPTFRINVELSRTEGTALVEADSLRDAYRRVEQLSLDEIHKHFDTATVSTFEVVDGWEEPNPDSESVVTLPPAPSPAPTSEPTPNIDARIASSPKRTKFANVDDGFDALHAGFTQKELRRGLAAVMDLDHWKNPIEASFDELTDYEQRLLVEAMVYSTGAGQVDAVTIDDKRVFIASAPGYYAVIGS